MEPLADVITGLERLREACEGVGRDVPSVAVGGLVHVDAPDDHTAPEALAATVASNYGITPERAANIPMTGSPAAVAEQFAAHAQAGVSALVLNAVGTDWDRQIELIAEARALAGV